MNVYYNYANAVKMEISKIYYGRSLCLRLVGSKHAFTSYFLSLIVRALKNKRAFTTDFTSVFYVHLKVNTRFLFALIDFFISVILEYQNYRTLLKVI